MSTLKTTNLQHPSAASPAIVLDAAGGATVAGMGLVLVKPTSIANSGGTATASGGAVTFTGVTSLSLNGVFTTTYDNYRVVVVATSSGSGDIDFRMRVAGADNSSANYSYQYINGNAGSITGGRNTGLTSAWFMSATASRAIASTDFASPALAIITTSTGLQQTGNVGINIFGNVHNVASAFDGITLISASTATGIVRVYGYQNS